MIKLESSILVQKLSKDLSCNDKDRFYELLNHQNIEKAQLDQSKEAFLVYLKYGFWKLFFQDLEESEGEIILDVLKDKFKSIIDEYYYKKKNEKIIKMMPYDWYIIYMYQYLSERFDKEIVQ